MLFLLKRRWDTALAAGLLMAALALGLRQFLPHVPEFEVSPINLALGVGVVCAVVCSDLLLHVLFRHTLGPRYIQRYRELAGLFRGQSLAAILAGGLMAGCGEELVFRGLTDDPAVLAGAAVVFGLLHHTRRSLWLFTAWAGYQGLLFAAALSITGSLFVTMFAHFLHDVGGFLVFRHLNRTGPSEGVTS